jgi:hypothetical protein
MIRDIRQNIILTDNMYIKEYNKNENYVITDGKKNIIDLEIDDNNKCIVIGRLNDKYEIENIYSGTRQMIIKNIDFIEIIRMIPDNIEDVVVIKDRINILFDRWYKNKNYYYMIENIERYDEKHLEEMIRMINEEGNVNMLKIIINRKNYKILYRIVDRIKQEIIEEIFYDIIENNILSNNLNYDDLAFIKLSMKCDINKIIRKNNNKNNKNIKNNIFHYLAKNNTDNSLFKKLYERVEDKYIINEIDENGMSVIHYLLNYNNIKLIYLVMDNIYVETVNMIDKNNNNMIYYYNHSKDDNIIEFLMINMRDEVFNKINDRRMNILFKILEFNGNLYNRINNTKSKELIDKILGKMTKENLLYRDEFDNTILSCLIKNGYYECVEKIIDNYDEFYINILNILELLIQTYSKANNEYYRIYDIIIKKINNENLRNSYRVIFKTVDEYIIRNYINEIKNRKLDYYNNIIHKYIIDISRYTILPDEKFVKILNKILENDDIKIIINYNNKLEIIKK